MLHSRTFLTSVLKNYHCFENITKAGLRLQNQARYFKLERLRPSAVDNDPKKQQEKVFKVLQDEKKDTAEIPTKEEKKTMVSTVKEYIRMRRDFSQKYTDNNTITAVRAMQEFALKPSELKDLRMIKIRSPYKEGTGHLLVYLERDVLKKAIEVYGSLEGLEREQKRIKKLQEKQKMYLDGTFIKPEDNEKTKRFFMAGPGRVVAVAAGANGVIFGFKLVCWLWTGSASMFAETLHSFADMCNQLLLLWGVYQSTKTPDQDHPYGFGNMRYIVSLISGVGIFCIGCGASVYHGVTGLVSGHSMLESVTNVGAFGVLFGSALIESASLIVAFDETKHNAKQQGLTFWEYIKSSQDPSTNVVLLEDSCAVLGVGIAASALAITQYMGNPVYDCVGSLAIGGLLGVVATFLVRSNIDALIGQSIPQNQLNVLREDLEDDAVIRGVYDIKATQLGFSEYKFKAEIDFDGREITRAYLESKDLEILLGEYKSINSQKDLEIFLLNHGEQIIDMLGVQVDRLETDLKKKNPGLRHIDLEVL